MLSAASLVAAPAWARGPDPRRMHDWMGWRWDGRWFGPLCMIALLVLQIAGTVALVGRTSRRHRMPHWARRLRQVIARNVRHPSHRRDPDPTGRLRLRVRGDGGLGDPCAAPGPESCAQEALAR